MSTIQRLCRNAVHPFEKDVKCFKSQCNVLLITYKSQ